MVPATDSLGKRSTVDRRGHRIAAAIYDPLTRPLERMLVEHRTRLLADLAGDLLDVGAGTGANLPHYPPAARVVAAEPDRAMRARLTAKLTHPPVRANVEVADVAAESLPYPDASFDALIYTLVLCTVTDPDLALAEARRVLRPGGTLAVLEHVRGTGRLARWQDRLTPLWSRLAAGCHPNRDIHTAIHRAGFTIHHAETFHPLPGWIPTNPWLQARAD